MIKESTYDVSVLNIPIENPLLQERHIWGYGIGNFGFGGLAQLMASFFVFYVTAVLGLPGVVVGLIVGLSIFLDAISDPIMGYISDMTVNSKYGRRHLYLWIGCLSMLISNLILWNLTSALPRWFLVVTLTTALLLVKTAMTIYGTPYTALGAELTHDHALRTKVQSIRMSFFMIGIFFAAAVSMLVFFKPTVAYPVGQLNPISYRIMSLFTSAILLLTGIIAILSTKHMIPSLNKRILNTESAGIKDFFHMMVHAFKHDDLRVIIVGYLFTNLAAAILNGIGLHVYTYTFLMTNISVAWIIGGQLFIAVLSQPFWLKLNKVHDKMVSIRLGLTLSMIASVYFTFCVLIKDFASTHIWILIPFVFFAGVGSGGLFTLPQAMVADCVDENALNTGKRQEGIYYGVLTLSFKLSQSVAIFVIGIIVDLVGFNSALATQSEGTILALGLFLGLGTLLMFIGARKAYKSYKITRERLAEIHRGLLERDATI